MTCDLKANKLLCTFMQVNGNSSATHKQMESKDAGSIINEINKIPINRENYTNKIDVDLFLCHKGYLEKSKDCNEMVEIKKRNEIAETSLKFLSDVMFKLESSMLEAPILDCGYREIESMRSDFDSDYQFLKFLESDFIQQISQIGFN